MAKLMNMPKIGVNMTDGTVTEWYVTEGDEVKFGEMALAAETDKDVQDIPADQSGTVLKIIAQIGDNVLCHEPLAIVGEAGENIDDLLAQIAGSGEAEAVEAPAAAPAEAPKAEVVAASATTPAGRVPISPLAKKMAKDMGLDYTKVPYTGKRITKSDILAYEVDDEVPALAPPDVTVSAQADSNTAPYSGIRKKIGDRMTESVTTKPWAALSVDVDMTETMAFRAKVNEMAEVKVGFNEILAKACARALMEYPKMNTHLTADGTEIYEYNDANVGIAVSTDTGLMVPVLKNAEKKGVVELSKEFKGLVERTKNRENISGDLSGGTFTISNLGSRGIKSFRAVINPPECGILAVGSIVKTPVVVDDEIAVRPLMNLTLSFDHRMVDGDYAAQFLAYIQNLLEDPMKIIM